MINLCNESKSFYTGFLNSLKGLTNPETIQNFPGYDEIIMDFDMFCESILTWPELSKEQHEKLQKLYNMLENYDEYHSDNERKTDEEICNDPEWHKIREFAKVVYDDLKNVKYIPDEKNPK